MRWKNHFIQEEKLRINEARLRHEHGLEPLPLPDSTSELYLAYASKIRSKSQGTPECLRQLSDTGENYLEEVVTMSIKVLKFSRLKFLKNRIHFSNFDKVFKLGFEM